MSKSNIWINKSRKQKKLDIIRLLNNTRTSKHYWQQFMTSPFLDSRGIKVVNDKLSNEPIGYTDGFIIVNSHSMFNYEIISSECTFLDNYTVMEYKHALDTQTPTMVIGAEFLYDFQYGIGLRLIVPSVCVTQENIIEVIELFVKNNYKEFYQEIRKFTKDEIDSLKSRVIHCFNDK